MSSCTKIALLIDLNSFPLPRTESRSLVQFEPPLSSIIAFPGLTTVKLEPTYEPEFQLDDGNVAPNDDSLLNDLLTPTKLKLSTSNDDVTRLHPLIGHNDMQNLFSETLVKPKIQPLSENDQLMSEMKENTTNENFLQPPLVGDKDIKHLITETLLEPKIEKTDNQTRPKFLKPKSELFDGDSPIQSPLIRIFENGSQPSDSGQSEPNRTYDCPVPSKSPISISQNSNSGASFSGISPRVPLLAITAGLGPLEPEDAITMDSFPSLLEMNLKRLQEAILEQMIKDSTICGEFDPSNVQWTYKFFDSAQPTKGTRRNKRFMPFDLSNFETFEEDLAREVTNYSNGKTFNDPGKLESLSAGIKNITCDLHWSNTFTPNTNSSKKSTPSRSETINSRNYIYVYQCVPRTESEMLEYTGSVTTMCSSQNFLNALLPKPFFQELHRKHKIRVNLVDLWHLHDGFGLAQGEEWKDGTYHKPIPHVLHYLNGGKILPITVTNIGKELPPWKAFLKGLLGSKSLSGIPCHDNKTKRTTGHEKVITGRERVEGIKNLVQPVTNKPSHSSSRSRRGENMRTESQPSDHHLFTFALTDRMGLGDSQRSRTDVVPYNKGSTRRSGRRYHNIPADSRLAVPNTSFLKKHTSEKQILVCASEWKNLKRRDQERAEILKQVFTAAPVPTHRPTPKKAVRRNLFSTGLTSEKDIENLIKMSNSNLRSPGFGRSPARVSRPLLPKSPYSAAATSEIRDKILKSKRRLHLDSFDDGDEADDEENCNFIVKTSDSPNLRFPRTMCRLAGVLAQENSLVLCPESPATPAGKRIRRHTSSNLASSEKKVVQESPESFPKYHGTSPLKRIASTSFYSVSSSEKSRVWEKSGNLLKAAKIKESVERSQLALEENFLTMQGCEEAD